MSRYPRTRVLLVDMQLAGGNVLRKLNEGKYYWFIEIEELKSSGAFQNRTLWNLRISKREWPTYEDVLQKIRQDYERPLPQESLPAHEYPAENEKI